MLYFIKRSQSYNTCKRRALRNCQEPIHGENADTILKTRVLAKTEATMANMADGNDNNKTTSTADSILQ